MTGPLSHETVWHAPALHKLLSDGGNAAMLLAALDTHGCLAFPQLASGLFPAIQTSLDDDKTGYANAWLRDSSCVALGLLAHGEKVQSSRAVRGVLHALHEALPTIERAIASRDIPLPNELRIPSRFAGDASAPRSEWANAQNDSIGYALLLMGTAVHEGILAFSPKDIHLLDRILEYLEHIRYWEDADSGHWEEVKKCNASSIGTVLAGIRAIEPCLPYGTRAAALFSAGQAALENILPYETRGGLHERATDAALIGLIEPLGVVEGEMAARIIADVEAELVGTIGIARYRGDSYWAPDYRSHFAIGVRASDFSDESDMETRNAFLTPGDEAQWTLFDSLLAMYYVAQGSSGHQHAVLYLNRALAQIVELPSGEWRIPEAFFLEDGHWVPNDHVGLLWAQVNLIRAIDSCSELFPLEV